MPRTRKTPRPIAPLPTDQERLYRLPAVEEISGLRRATIYSWISDGRFPPQLKIGASALWRKSDIDSWLASQVAGR